MDALSCVLMSSSAISMLKFVGTIFWAALLASSRTNLKGLVLKNKLDLYLCSLWCYSMHAQQQSICSWQPGYRQIMLRTSP